MLDFLLENDVLSAIIAFALVLIPAVLVHEFGHFLAARRAGITVLEFGIGFPPRIKKLFTWKETEFTLNWLIFLGGFVRPLGEDFVRPLSEAATEQERAELLAQQSADSAEKRKNQPETPSAARGNAHPSEREQLAARGVSNIKAVYEAKPWPRMLFMAAGAIANFIFAFLIFVLIGLIDMPEKVGVGVGFSVVAVDSPLVEVGLREGDIITGVDGEYLASTEELLTRLEAAIDTPVTLQIRREETENERSQQLDLEIVPTATLLAAFRDAHQYLIVLTIEGESPAFYAGLLPDDRITQMNGENLVDLPDPSGRLNQLTTAQAGQEVTLTVLRNGETLDIRLTPRTNPPARQGRIGISVNTEYVTPDWSLSYVELDHYETSPQSPPVALRYGIERTAYIFRLILEFPARLLANETEPEERRIVSPVGVSQMGGKILQNSIEEAEPSMILDYIALISIALGFTNLLPIPAFDGGRILFVIIEIIRGKPIAPEREGLVHLAGLLFLLTVGVFFIINDIVNPLTNVIP